MNESIKNFNIKDAYDLISSKLVSWMESAISMFPNMIISLLIIMLFVFLASLSKKLTYNIFGRITHNNSLRNLVGAIVYIIVFAIGSFTALSILNLDGVVTSLLAGAGVLGLALGFAFQEIASNYIAGTVMSIKKPFEMGDLIKTNDYFGTVIMIHLRTTHLKTLEGQLVTIPNAEIFKSPITNYSTLQSRRVDIKVGISYNEDLNYAKEIAYKAITEIKDINKEDISLFYEEFNDSSIDLNVRFWIDFSNRQIEYASKMDEGIIAIKKAFDAANITIPFPIKTIEFGSLENVREVLNPSKDTGKKLE